MDEPSTGDPLKELAAELEITPSPNFAARVQRQIEGQIGAAPWWNPLMRRSVLAGIAIIVVSALVAYRVMTKPSVSGALAQRVATPVVPVPSAPKDPEVPADVRSIRPMTTLAGVPDDQSGSAIVSHDNVLVSPDQAIALRRLLSGIRSGRIDVPRESRAPVDANGLLLEPAPIQIPLIQIEPMAALLDDDSQERK